MGDGYPVYKYFLLNIILIIGQIRKFLPSLLVSIKSDIVAAIYNLKDQ